MARRGLSPTETERRAREAAHRMLATGERPGYRLRPAQDGRYSVLEAPWLSVPKRSAGRAAIAAWLGCDPDAFDLET